MKTSSPTLALVALLSVSGCSWADRAQIADATTTAIALNSGYAEANPVLGGLSAPAIAAVKIGATQLVKLTPPEICEPGLTVLTVGGFAGALWNIGVMAGSGLAAIPFVIGLTWAAWDDWRADAKATCADPWNFTH